MNSIGRIGFVGGGNMAEAFIKGLIQAGFSASAIQVFEPSQKRLDELRALYGIRAATDNAALVEGCDTLVLAVKPQIAHAVLEEMAVAFDESKLLISIAAGVSTLRIEEHFDGAPKVVRAMPNTPALVGEGAAAICPGRFSGEAELETAGALFKAVGSVVVVGEEQLDAVTGLSGSGPAYVYTFIEALADGGVQQGLTREVALKLAVQTVLGAARLVQQTGEHPALLRDKVCSPGGTTITAMRVLEERGLRATLMEAVCSATRRSRELGKG